MLQKCHDIMIYFPPTVFRVIHTHCGSSLQTLPHADHVSTKNTRKNEKESGKKERSV